MFKTRCAAAPCWAEASAATLPAQAQAECFHAVALASSPQATTDGTHQDAGR